MLMLIKVHESKYSSFVLSLFYAMLEAQYDYQVQVSLSNE